MQNNFCNGSYALFPRGFMALCVVMLAIELGLMASRAEAAPFAYVGNEDPFIVSVIDTATNMVVAKVQLDSFAAAIAVTPDGKHIYVTNGNTPGTVSVIDTATNKVMATVSVGNDPSGVAITPDGKRAYVTNSAFSGNSGTASVIDTATNIVVATFPVGSCPIGVAVTPDGKYAYVANETFPNGTVSVIDTASNTVVDTIPVVSDPRGVAITPDGKRAYITNFESTVSVIATATNTVVGTVGVRGNPAGVAVTPDGAHVYVTTEFFGTVAVIATASDTVVATVGGLADAVGVAITPDGKHAYVANNGSSNNISVIATASNTVVATLAVGGFATAVGIMQPTVGVPFLAFNAKLEIGLDRKPNKDSFELESSFDLSSTAPRIHPVVESVTLQIGTFSITIPPGSFRKHEDEGEGENEDGFFTFHGVIDGVRLKALIKRTGTLRYAFDAEAKGTNLTGTKNPVYVTLAIGGDSGATSVTAAITP